MKNQLDFEKQGGLVPVIVQDHKTGEVLMLAYMNQQSFEETLKTKTACYYSRSRNTLWRKGEQSGNIQKIEEIRIDCDKDTILIKVEQIGGAACHTGYRSCFSWKIEDGSILEDGVKVFDPREVYK
ncbi:MAG: phosphoribosyl-AMP cyclohydrolase [Deltaproteobacteria bacterium]|nr:phosphoribosyl-AMP cyclohydrolase [Deltaproteobacteria bacterium]